MYEKMHLEIMYYEQLIKIEARYRKTYGEIWKKDRPIFASLNTLRIYIF